MIDAANTALNQAPKALDGVGVNLSNYIDLGAMVDSPMVVSGGLPVFGSHGFDSVIPLQFVGIDGAGGQYVLPNIAKKSRPAHIRCSQGNHATAAFNHPDNGSLFLVATPRSADAILADAAVVGFVDLNRRTLQLYVRFREQFPNLMEHAPCSFVSDAAFPLNLFRGNSAPSRTHQVHGIEPSLERGSGLFKDGPGKRVNLSTAMIAAISGALLYPVVFAVLSTLGAIGDAAGPALLTQIGKAGVVCRKLFVEVPKGIAQFLRDALFGFHYA